MTAAPAGGLDIADAIARVLAGPFVWRTAMPPQGGPELDAVRVVESAMQVGEFAINDAEPAPTASKRNNVPLAPDQAFSRSQENAQVADQASSATAEERAIRGDSATDAADGGRTRSEAHAGYAPGDVGSSGYTGPEQGERDGLAAAARARFADVLAHGGVPSIRTLRAEYGIGQARAQRVQAALRRVPAAV